MLYIPLRIVGVALCADTPFPDECGLKCSCMNARPFSHYTTKANPSAEVAVTDRKCKHSDIQVIRMNV